MSEFSESFHLVATSIDAGQKLLERAGLGGWVFPATAGWVTVLADPAPSSESGAGDYDIDALESGAVRTIGPPVDSPLVAALSADQVLVWYLYYEDHGWGLAVWKGPELVSEATKEWTFGDFTFADGLDIERVTSVLAGAHIRPEPDLNAVAAALGDLQELTAYSVAGLVGWGEYEWLWGDFVERHADEYPAAVRFDPGVA